MIEAILKTSDIAQLRPIRWTVELFLLHVKILLSEAALTAKVALAEVSLAKLALAKVALTAKVPVVRHGFTNKAGICELSSNYLRTQNAIGEQIQDLKWKKYERKCNTEKQLFSD